MSDIGQQPDLTGIPPERHLDARVAWAMGYRNIFLGYNGQVWARGPRGHHEMVPHHVSSAGLGPMLEWLTASGWKIQLSTYLGSGRVWMCQLFVWSDSNRNAICVDADTPWEAVALAIVKAAKKGEALNG